jgi:hypothetical protein
MKSTLRIINTCISQFPFSGKNFHGVRPLDHKKINSCAAYLILFVCTALFGCAQLVPYPQAPPFSQQETAQLIAGLRTQEDKVASFQGIGKLRFKDGEEVSEANLLAVGSRPLKVRLEISHPWGSPLFFLVVNEKHTQAVSFVEKKVFRGDLSHLPVRQFSVLMLDLDSTWMVLSGCVPVLPHGRAASLKPYEIRLFDTEEEVREIITFSPGSRLPRSVSFPDKGIAVVWSDYERSDWGLKPSRIVIMSEVHNQSAEIRYKRLLINRSVPEEIFRLAPPPGFEIVELNPQEM